MFLSLLEAELQTEQSSVALCIVAYQFQAKTCRLSQPEREECKQHVTALLAKGVTYPSCSSLVQGILDVAQLNNGLPCLSKTSYTVVDQSLGVVSCWGGCVSSFPVIN